MTEQTITAGAITGGSASILGFLASSEVIAVSGLAIAVGTFAVNVWFKRRTLKLEREKFEWEKGQK